MAGRRMVHTVAATNANKKILHHEERFRPASAMAMRNPLRAEFGSGSKWSRREFSRRSSPWARRSMAGDVRRFPSPFVEFMAKPGVKVRKRSVSPWSPSCYPTPPSDVRRTRSARHPMVSRVAVSMRNRLQPRDDPRRRSVADIATTVGTRRPPIRVQQPASTARSRHAELASPRGSDKCSTRSPRLRSRRCPPSSTKSKQNQSEHCETIFRLSNLQEITPGVERLVDGIKAFGKRRPTSTRLTRLAGDDGFICSQTGQRWRSRTT